MTAREDSSSPDSMKSLLCKTTGFSLRFLGDGGDGKRGELKGGKNLYKDGETMKEDAATGKYYFRGKVCVVVKKYF